MARLKQKICERIFELDSRPEETLITEQILADYLGISRTPVREVLRDLEQEKLIERKKKKGIILKQPDIKKITEIYDARTALEGFAARLAAGQITENDISELKKIIKLYANGIGKKNPEKYITASTQFHSKIIKIAGNSIIADTIERLVLLKRVFYLKLPGTQLTSNQKNPFSHEMIVKVLAQHDPVKSEEAMRNHIQWGKQRAIELMLNTMVCSLGDEIKKAG